MNKTKAQKTLFVSNRIRHSNAENVGYAIVILLLVLICFTTLYPFWHVLMYSISDSKASMSGGFFFLPRDINFYGYEVLFHTNQIFIAFKNTILKTGVGTLLSLAISALTAYPLAQKRLRGRNFFAVFFFFTILFSGGVIPTYMVVKDLGMIDSFTALIIPGCLSVYYMFILRNCFQSIPSSVEESARIDGANSLTTLVRIVLPMSKPTLAALALFYAVFNWNSYFDCLLYTNSTNLQVLQIYLRSILQLTSAAAAMSNSGMQTSLLTDETMKMVVIAVTVIPIMMVYPFLQRYYTKGLTVGAVKG